MQKEIDPTKKEEEERRKKKRIAYLLGTWQFNAMCIMCPKPCGNSLVSAQRCVANASGDVFGKGSGISMTLVLLTFFPYALVMMSNALGVQKRVLHSFFFHPWRLLSPFSFKMLSCYINMGSFAWVRGSFGWGVDWLESIAFGVFNYCSELTRDSS